MAITTNTIVTTTRTTRITLNDEELSDGLRTHFDVSITAEVEFDIRQGSYLAGCTITEITQATEEESND